MAGLGIGSALLGRVADRKPAPLAWYGALELGIAMAAAISPLLIMAARALYIALGGAVSLGLPLASLLRIVLTVLVLGIPTFLMGGTLPAAARAVETQGDHGRRRLALMYGMNTLGAVAGALVTTFVLLELLGNRQTLLLAALLNAVVALVALVAGRKRAVPADEVQEDSAAVQETPPSRRRLGASPVTVAAAIVGFAFFLMELVWYRMLAPLLGGTTFTFGLILAMALLGIGLGGGAYAMRAGSRRPTAGAFAITCTLEALAIIIPFALGDRLAVLASLLRSLAAVGFAGNVLAWSLVTAIVVLPAAFIAGIQFPILVALLGEGRKDVGRDVGAAYAWNTAGAIAGALAGGFGLLPLLTAPGAWRLVTVLLTALGFAAAIAALRSGGRRPASVAIAAGVAAIACTLFPGPSAVWRHTAIGAGRAMLPQSPAELREWANTARRTLLWEAEGRESSIAVAEQQHSVFIVNGKIDGGARGDDTTQVMGGLIGAILHPDPRSALVVGLGTGSTAGWLAAVDSMERVDVVELEPAVVRVAHEFDAVNGQCMSNPKVDIHINDAREVLLTTPERYDIIFSEPSNPYRGGIASLYTREFYEAAAGRLQKGGIFLQWVQMYEIDAETVRTVYATLTSVFKQVDTWQTNPADLIIVASADPIPYDIDRIRDRMQKGTFRDAAHNAWRVETAEGVLSHFIGNDRLARTLAAGQELNTDDRTVIEFGFARSVGSKGRFDVNDLIRAAKTLGAQRPAAVSGQANWELAELNRWTHPWKLPEDAGDLVRARHDFTVHYLSSNLPAASALWRSRPWNPVNSAELSRLAEVLAEEGLAEAESFIRPLRAIQPVEAAAIEARLRWKQGHPEDAARGIEEAFDGWRRNPWALPAVMSRALDTAWELAAADKQHAARMLAATERPFLAGQLEDQRRIRRVYLAHESEAACGPATMAALHEIEPFVPWTESHLTLRHACYAEARTALARVAARDLAEYRHSSPQPLMPD